MSAVRVRGPLCRVVQARARRIVLRAATRRDVPHVAGAGAAASVAEHRLIPDIASPRHDARAARQYWRRAIASPRKRLFVAVCRNELLGAIGVDLIVSRHRMAHVRRRIYVHSLFIDPSARRLGLAHLLTRLALDWGRGRGATQARLEMAAPNRSARRLYESAGFRVREMMFARPL